jgi:hypothetical protein
MTLRYVPFHEVESFLRAGWMVVSPNRYHPVLDSFRALMVRFCDCGGAS